MTTTSRHDAWQAGDSYDLYMGRWSRRVAPVFLDWLGPARGLDWLEVGCGTGALSAAILSRCEPHSLLGIDQSEGFVARARTNVPDTRATFQVGDAQALGAASDGVDVVVSALVLNFLPDREKALVEMQRVARRGAIVGFYVWDYPAGGVEFIRAFWEAAAILDPAAAELAEGSRFRFCNRADLIDLATRAGLQSLECTRIEVATVFTDFEDFWRPFALGAGPAPGYCASLDPEARQRLKERLQADLPFGADGSIALSAAAWGVKGRVG